MRLGGGTHSTSTAVSLAGAAAVVGLVSVGLSAVGLDATASAFLLLLTVAVLSLRGTVTGLVAALAASVGFSLGFTPPRGSVGFEGTDDLVAAGVFVAVAGLIGTLVGRATELRRAADLRATEARLRADATARLLRGEDPTVVATGAVEELARLLGTCHLGLRVGSIDATASTITGGHTLATRTLEIPPTQVTLAWASERASSAVEDDVLRSFASGLGTALERASFERAAGAARVDAELSRSRAAFFAAAGHNLRNPLATLAATAEALRTAGDDLDPAERKALLDDLVSETDRLSRLVGDVLALSRLRAGVLTSHVESIDIGDVVHEAVGRIDGLTGRVLHIDLDRSPHGLHLDRSLTHLLLQNLLENAADYAPTGTPVEVIGRPVAGDGYEIRVIDHGPGVPEAERDRVFDEFHRGDRSDRPGTGLGLAITRAVAALQGGTVRCVETPGGGATFVATFPAALRPPDPGGDP